MELMNRSWDESVTHMFNQQELAELQGQDAQTIIQRLRLSTGGVVIRALVELLAHGDVDKLREVGSDPEVQALWQSHIVATFSPDMFYLMALMKFFDAQDKGNAELTPQG